jgi:hypothetical protein
MNKNILLVVAVVLVGIGLLKPDVSKFLSNKAVAVAKVEIPAPTGDVKVAAEKVIQEIKKTDLDREIIGKLRDLYADLAILVSLKGEDLTVTTTEEVRQANGLAGKMLGLDLKGKYPELSKASKEVVVAAIGDDVISMNDTLRVQGTDAFAALAWAYNEVVK